METKVKTEAKTVGMTRRELADAWAKALPGVVGIGDIERVVTLVREHLVMCEGLDNAGACEVITRLVGYLQTSPDAPVDGKLVPASEAGAEILTLYIDATPPVDWPALARVGDRWSFALSDRRILWPTPPEA